MDRKQYRILTSKLSELDNAARRKLYQRAAKQRIDDRVSPGEKPRSLDEIAFALLAQDETGADATGPGAEIGTVSWVGLKTCRVGAVECALNKQRVAVGDHVTYDPKLFLLRSVLPRSTLLSRPDPDNHNTELLIAANIDLVVVVVSVKAPPLHVRIIDRYLITIERSGAQAALCVNKLDLLSADERALEFEKLLPYSELGLSIIGCSTEIGEGVDEIRTLVHGKTCAFVGHSGVGKSSLLNAIAPGITERIGDVSEGYGRGRHTTTWSSLHELGDGTRIIDTPGIRSLGIGELTLNELQWHFPEFANVKCKFSNCSHTHEPNCGVKDALGKEIGLARYETYRRLLDGN
ncbi:MAG: ribosome small subunit-dependent GTPase A [Armatimonadota bacterium]|nr:ribosome small subunit-dependent GTPase A [Armatimonadota bacterium]